MEKVNLRRTYSSKGKRSYIIDDLITDTFTINKEYRPKTYGDMYVPCKEVKAVDYKVVNDINRLNTLIDSQGRKGKKPLRPKRLLSILHEVVFDLWSQTKDNFNVIFHSSGWDSRLLSSIIRKAYLEDPKEVIFICWEPEGALFKDIIRYEGWDEDQFFILDRYNYKEFNMFDFKDAWRMVNGVSHYPINEEIFSIEYLQRQGRIPEDNYVVWPIGWGGNETLISKVNLESFIRRWYYAYPARLRPYLDQYVPYLDLRVIKEIFEHHPVENNVAYRQGICKTFDSKLCRFSRGDHPKETIPKWVLSKCVSDYKESFYYRHIDQSFTSTPYVLARTSWWPKWTLASFIDHLREKGVEIIWQ